MKKIRNLVIGGIENKIFNLVLVTIVLIVAAYTIVISYQANSLHHLVEKTNAQQKESISEISKTTMDAVVTNTLTNDTMMKANLAEAIFHEVESNVRTAGDYAQVLFEEPDSVSPETAALPDASKDGTVSVQLLAEEGVDLSDPELSERLGLIANMSGMLESVYNHSTVDSCFIGLPEGVFLIADDRAGDKFDEDGGLKTIPVTQRPWYTGAAAKKDLYFTDVETDAFNGQIGIVCALPVYHEGKLAAVVGADLFLDSLQEAVAASDQYGGFICIVNEQGHVIFSPKKEGIFQVRLSSKSEDLRASGSESLAAFVNDSMKELTPVRVVEAEGIQYYMSGAPIPTVGWTIMNSVSKEEADSPTAMMEEQPPMLLVFPPGKPITKFFTSTL